MTDTSSGNWDMTIVLPLGVVAGQFAKLEMQLRSLNMAVVGLARVPDTAQPAVRAEAHLDAISDRLDSIRQLVSDIQRDLHLRARIAENSMTTASVLAPKTANPAIREGLYAQAHDTRVRERDRQRDRDD